MTTLLAYGIIITMAAAMLHALYRVIRAAMREGEPESAREARIIEAMCKRPRAWGERKP